MQKLIFFLIFLIVQIDCTKTTQTPQGCAPIKLQNGRVRYRQRQRFIKFQCNTGYNLAGEKYSTCVNGEWEGPLPKCVRASCSTVRPPLHGYIYPSHRGGVLNFFCQPGYTLKGTNVTYCDGKQWDNNLPSCLETNGSVPLYCDFEEADLCGWSHDLRHDFDWTRMNYHTPSGHIGTGPSFDHTHGRGGQGYYMYIESTSRNENDTARLISPIFEKTSNNTCLEFFYHMYGKTIGQLKVYLKKLTDDWILNDQKTIFSKSDNQGDIWLKSLIPLGAIDEDYQIIFEGIRGANYLSDIAIDDVRIIENCHVDEEIEDKSDIFLTQMAFPSCENQCGVGGAMGGANNVCACDDACVDLNSCCPDYITFCVLGETDSTVKTEETTESTELTESETSPPTTISTRSTVSTIGQIYTESTFHPTHRWSQTTRPLPTTTTTTPPTTTHQSTIAIDKVEAPPTIPDSDLDEVTMTPTTTPILVMEHYDLVAEKTHISPASLLLILGVSILLLISLILLLVTGGKYVRYRHRRRGLRSSGDSQSDVRFLTQEEQLDFTLANPLNVN